MMVKFEKKVLRIENKDVIKVLLDYGKYQGFYRNTNVNMLTPGVWFPFDGIKTFGNTIWFDKFKYIKDKSIFSVPDKLHRYGTHEYKDISNYLSTLEIQEGKESTYQEINSWIGKYGYQRKRFN